MAIGFAVGLIIPVLTWIMAGVVLKSYTDTLEKPAVPYLIGVAANLFVIRYFFKKDLDQSGTGAILCTFIYMAAVFLFKIGHWA